MKRMLSVLMVFCMLLCIVPAYAADGITVYLSVSRYGEHVTDKDGKTMAYVPIELSGQESYTIDDVFSEAHALHHPDGAEAYATSYTEEWGLGVAKLWGDTSYNFGYQVNGGRESVMGPGHEVEDGDSVDVYIYQNSGSEMENYARFESVVEEGYTNDEILVTLSCFSGYDENWNMVFSPCEGASILINGEETDLVTDENGAVTLYFEEEGNYVISSKKTKVLSDEVVTAITAPVCVLQVTLHPAIQMIHNIAQQYAESDFAAAGGNLPWILADMAVYEELFPESKFCLSAERKQKGLSEISAFAKSATRPGDLAKSILALRALGYDAEKLYTAEFEQINLVEKLLALVDSEDEAVTNIYTLPYVIIALRQAEGYASDEQMAWLIEAALTSKSSWQDTAFGTDALTPMLLALAPFCEENTEVGTAVEETVEILQAEQREDGLINGFEGYEPASTGLAICGLSAIGIDASEVVSGENSLIDGLLSVANEESNGFANAFATEQGYRGLLAWRLLQEETGKTMYDFSSSPMEEANVTGATSCPVVFTVTPSGATVTIEGETELLSNVFDLTEGEYSYTVAASSYITKSGTLTISAEEAENREAKTVTVSLASRPSYSGGGGVSVNVDEDKQNEDKTEAEAKPEAEIMPEAEPETVAPIETVFSDVNRDDWYYTAVEYAYHNKLFNGTGNGFSPEKSMTRAMLVTVLHRVAAPETKTQNNPFTDVAANSWYTDSVIWAANSGLVQGISDSEFAPEASITREQLAVILYRYAVLSGYETEFDEDILSYSDAASVSSYAQDAMRYAVGLGILQGNQMGQLAPGNTATRAEVATMLMRFLQGIEK